MSAREVDEARAWLDVNAHRAVEAYEETDDPMHVVSMALHFGVPVERVVNALCVVAACVLKDPPPADEDARLLRLALGWSIGDATDPRELLRLHREAQARHVPMHNAVLARLRVEVMSEASVEAFRRAIAVELAARAVAIAGMSLMGAPLEALHEQIFAAAHDARILGPGMAAPTLRIGIPVHALEGLGDPALDPYPAWIAKLRTGAA